jgi:hypothetical protein
LIALLERHSEPLKGFHASTLLKEIRKASEEDLKEFREKKQVLNGLTDTILQARQDEKAYNDAVKRFKNKKIENPFPPYTRDIYRIFIDFCVVNKTMNMTPSEWLDAWNMIVPVSYSDFVLLDKRWCEFLKQNIKLTYPNIAKYYWANELDQFIEDLKKFKAS